MRILISTIYNGSFAYIPDLVEAFNKRGFVCDVYDIAECKLIQNNLKSDKYLINKKVLHILHRLQLTKTESFLRKYLNLKFYQRFKNNYDILTIHYIFLAYYDYIELIKIFSKKTVAVAWGSDIYRINDNDYHKLSHIINSIDYFIANKPMVEYLASKKAEVKNSTKTRHLFIVSKSIDNLAKLMDEETKEHSKEQLGIPKDTFTISFGYNASVLQQHEFFIEILKNIRKELPNNTFILLQMTYREDRENYIDNIDKQLKSIGLNYKIFRNFLNEKEVLRIRRISDVTINIQTTDVLSSSIREHLFAQNVLIVGDWLPYGIYTEMDIYYLKTSLNNLGTTITDCIKNFEEHKLKVKKNKDLIYEKLSFEKNIDEWVDFYRCILSE